MASSWYQGQSQSTGVGATGMVFGITFGVDTSSSSSSDHSGGMVSGQSFSQFQNDMSNVSIEFEFGLCDIFRPWLLNELLVIDGWYLPGEAANAVSDGTIAGQKDSGDQHFLPMLPTQLLVVRHLKITANGWGDAGNQMTNYIHQRQTSDQSVSTSGAGGVGFLGFRGGGRHSNADCPGQD